MRYKMLKNLKRRNPITGNSPLLDGIMAKTTDEGEKDRWWLFDQNQKLIAST